MNTLNSEIELLKILENNYLTEKNVTKANFLVKYSAKSFPDYGDEEGCLSHKNNAFILFTIKYNYHNSN